MNSVEGDIEMDAGGENAEGDAGGVEANVCR